MRMDNEFDWIRRISREMEKWADESVRSMFAERMPGDGLWVPRVDIYETEDAVVVKICAAGVEASDLSLTLSADGRYLHIQGVRSDDHEARSRAVRYHQLEIYTGPFERTVALPHVGGLDRERVSAVARDGFFVVTLPKLAVDLAGPRSVPISSE